MMLSALLAALQIATTAPEWVWAEIYVDDSRGGGERIEILPQTAIDGDRRVLTGVVARRTSLFAGKPTNIRSTDIDKCPRLRGTLDAVVDVKPLANRSLSHSYEGPAAPPPPPTHRSTAQVKIGGSTMNAPADSPLGQWVGSIYQVTANCWVDGR